MSRLLVLAAGLALLILPGIAAAFPPAVFPPARPAALLLVQAPPDQGGANPTVAWAQARLSEIDAAITTLDVATRTLTSEARKQADDVLRKLRASRDAFATTIEGLASDARQRTEAEVAQARAALDAKWGEFERDLDAYLATSTTAASLRTAVLQARDRAEELYWQQAIAALKTAETTVAAERRSAIDQAIAALQSYADAAHARLAKLQQAGSDAWTAMQTGLADARRAFDKAYDNVQAAIDRARQ